MQEDKMKRYAYIRVSTKEQNIDRQIAALKGYEVPKKNIFCDYQSGKDFNRPQYQKLLKKLEAGDLLVIKSIDRLGRNYNEILYQWQYITKTLAVDIVVDDMELLDTREKEGSLTGTLISDLILQILAYVAETERNFIHQRQKEGIEIAKQKGKHLGRHPIELPEKFDEVCEEYLCGNLTVRKAASRLGMNHSTFYRKAEQIRTLRIANNEDNTAKNVSKGRLYNTL